VVADRGEGASILAGVVVGGSGGRANLGTGLQTVGDALLEVVGTVKDEREGVRVGGKRKSPSIEGGSRFLRVVGVDGGIGEEESGGGRHKGFENVEGLGSVASSREVRVRMLRRRKILMPFMLVR
jgi:hypothetical protein